MCFCLCQDICVCLYMRGAWIHALTEDVIFFVVVKLHTLSLGSRMESLRVWLTASSQPSWISLNCSCKLPTAQRVTSGLFPWYKVCSTSLSLSILVMAALISSVCCTGYCSDSGAIPNEQLDTGEECFVDQNSF